MWRASGGAEVESRRTLRRSNHSPGHDIGADTVGACKHAHRTPKIWMLPGKINAGMPVRLAYRVEDHNPLCGLCGFLEAEAGLSESVVQARGMVGVCVEIPIV